MLCVLLNITKVPYTLTGTAVYINKKIRTMTSNKRDREQEDEEFEEKVVEKKATKSAKKAPVTEEAVFSIGAVVALIIYLTTI